MAEIIAAVESFADARLYGVIAVFTVALLIWKAGVGMVSIAKSAVEIMSSLVALRHENEMNRIKEARARQDEDVAQGPRGQPG